MPGGGKWVGPVSSGIPFGFGMVIIYFSANAYIIDAFPGYVASALAAKTVIRSGSGAAMPLFITAMYHNLGNGWAASTWAFISLAMVSHVHTLSRKSGSLTSHSFSFLFPSFSTVSARPFDRSQNAPPRHRLFLRCFLLPAMFSASFRSHINASHGFTYLVMRTDACRSLLHIISYCTLL